MLPPTPRPDATARGITWETIAAMDEQTLNLAIEEAIYQRVWHLMPHHSMPHPWMEWACNGAPQGLQSGGPLQHTASWERTMTISRQYGVWSVPCYQPDIPYHRDPAQRLTWNVCCYDKALQVRTDAEERVARCRLALWRACQEAPGAA